MNLRSIFKVNLTTGEISRFIETTPVAEQLISVFYSRDRLPLGVIFTLDDVDVTTDVMANGATCRVGLRRYTGVGPILAQAVIQLVDGVLEDILDMDTDEMFSYMDALSDSQNEKPAYLEFEVTGGTGSPPARLTFNQTKATIRCEVNIEGDEPPTVPDVEGNAGKYLTTDGLTKSWAPLTGLRTLVSMPVDTASDGNAGEYAIGVDCMAIYRAGTGWIFFTGFQR